MGSFARAVSGVFLILLIIGGFGFVGYFCIYRSFTVNMGETEQYIFQYINEERVSRGLPSLGNDSNLCIIAKEWSDHLSEIKEVTHGNFNERTQSIGLPNIKFSTGEIIANFGSNFISFGENLPSDVARKLVNMWITSPPHREIMLTASTGYMGVAASNWALSFYSVVDFKFG